MNAASIDPVHHGCKAVGLWILALRVSAAAGSVRLLLSHGQLV